MRVNFATHFHLNCYNSIARPLQHSPRSPQRLGGLSECNFGPVGPFFFFHQVSPTGLSKRHSLRCCSPTQQLYQCSQNIYIYIYISLTWPNIPCCDLPTFPGPFLATCLADIPSYLQFSKPSTGFVGSASQTSASADVAPRPPTCPWVSTKAPLFPRKPEGPGRRFWHRCHFAAFTLTSRHLLFHSRFQENQPDF